MVLVGGTVTSVSRHGSFVFITVEEPDCGASVKYQFPVGDPRIAQFRFDDSMVVEATLVTDLDAVKKTVAWHNGEAN